MRCTLFTTDYFFAIWRHKKDTFSSWEISHIFQLDIVQIRTKTLFFSKTVTFSLPVEWQIIHVRQIKPRIIILLLNSLEHRSWSDLVLCPHKVWLHIMFSFTCDIFCKNWFSLFYFINQLLVFNYGTGTNKQTNKTKHIHTKQKNKIKQNKKQQNKQTNKKSQTNKPKTKKKSVKSVEKVT